MISGLTHSVGGNFDRTICIDLYLFIQSGKLKFFSCNINFILVWYYEVKFLVWHYYVIIKTKHFNMSCLQYIWESVENVFSEPKIVIMWFNWGKTKISTNGAWEIFKIAKLLTLWQFKLKTYLGNCVKRPDMIFVFMLC